jgi:hypothetical protein
LIASVIATAFEAALQGLAASAAVTVTVTRSSGPQLKMSPSAAMSLSETR